MQLDRATCLGTVPTTDGCLLRARHRAGLPQAPVQNFFPGYSQDMEIRLFTFMFIATVLAWVQGIHGT